MSKYDIKIANKEYKDVSTVKLKKTDGNTVSFHDVSETTATEEDVAKGKRFLRNNGEYASGTGYMVTRRPVVIFRQTPHQKIKFNSSNNSFEGKNEYYIEDFYRASYPRVVIEPEFGYKAGNIIITAIGIDPQGTFTKEYESGYEVYISPSSSILTYEITATEAKLTKFSPYYFEKNSSYDHLRSYAIDLPIYEYDYGDNDGHINLLLDKSKMSSFLGSDWNSKMTNKSFPPINIYCDGELAIEQASFEYYNGKYIIGPVTPDGVTAFMNSKYICLERFDGYFGYHDIFGLEINIKEDGTIESKLHGVETNVIKKINGHYLSFWTKPENIFHGNCSIFVNGVLYSPNVSVSTNTFPRKEGEEIFIETDCGRFTPHDYGLDANEWEEVKGPVKIEFKDPIYDAYDKDVETSIETKLKNIRRVNDAETEKESSESGVVADIYCELINADGLHVKNLSILNKNIDPDGGPYIYTVEFYECTNIEKIRRHFTGYENSSLKFGLGTSAKTIIPFRDFEIENISQNKYGLYTANVVAKLTKEEYDYATKTLLCYANRSNNPLPISFVGFSEYNEDNRGITCDFFTWITNIDKNDKRHVTTVMNKENKAKENEVVNIEIHEGEGIYKYENGGELTFYLTSAIGISDMQFHSFYISCPDSSSERNIFSDLPCYCKAYDEKKGALISVPIPSERFSYEIADSLFQNDMVSHLEQGYRAGSFSWLCFSFSPYEGKDTESLSGTHVIVSSPSKSNGAYIFNVSMSSANNVERISIIRSINPDTPCTFCVVTDSRELAPPGEPLEIYFNGTPVAKGSMVQHSETLFVMEIRYEEYHNIAGLLDSFDFEHQSLEISLMKKIKKAVEEPTADIPRDVDPTPTDDAKPNVDVNPTQ